MRKQKSTIITNETHFFRKIYLSHIIQNGCERVTKGLCMRGELETEQTATYWPPNSSVFSSTSFSFCWVAISGSWGPIALCWVLVLSIASYLPLTDSNSDSNSLELPVAPGYIIVLPPPASCERRICSQFKVIPWYIRLNAPVPWLTAVSKVSMLKIRLMDLFYTNLIGVNNIWWIVNQLFMLTISGVEDSIFNEFPKNLI